METEICVLQGSAHDISSLASQSVDLIVTSPPYPMIEMWDGVFAAQDQRLAKHLAAGEGHSAFELMHLVLDKAWAECARLLKPGGIACVNIGDATRTIAEECGARILTRKMDNEGRHRNWGYMQSRNENRNNEFYHTRNFTKNCGCYKKTRCFNANSTVW